MKNKKGFTLMEMMVVVLIIAGLAAIAYPVYTKAIIRARLAEAFSLTEIVREAEQRSLAVNGKYFYRFTNEHISGDTRLIKGRTGDLSIVDGALKKGLYTVSLVDETGDPAAANKSGCITVKYGEEDSNPIFTIYVPIEDSRIWCEEANSDNGICSTIPNLEQTAINCNSESITE